MSNAGDIASRFWNQLQKAREEEARERTFIDDIIQKDHIERLIRGHAGGIATAFDGGAGSGRFSIMLAQMGVRVVHFDISQPMIDATARSWARVARSFDSSGTCG